MIAEPIFFGRIIDAMSGGGSLLVNLVLWAALGIFSTVAFVVVAREADRLAHRRRVEVLTDSFSRVISMPLSWHSKRGTSNALHTLLRATEALSSLWLEFMRQHLSTAVAITLLVPTAFSMDYRLSSILVVLGIVYFMTSRLVIGKTKSGQASVEQHHHRVFAHVSDSISNVSVLHSYNRIEQETHQLRDYTKSLLSAQFPVLDWWALATGMHRMASTISMMVILIVGALLVSDGSLRVGEVVAFIGFANLLISRLDQFSQFVNQIFEARAKLEEFYALEDSVADRKEPEGATDLTNVRGHVRFENVSFSFDGSANGVSDIDFEAKAGETIAIVGPTGAGKTTLMNLLQRVFDPNSGRILIDGVDIATVTRKSLRNSIATVFQDAGLLNRSIADNIRLGRENASDDEIAAGRRRGCRGGLHPVEVRRLRNRRRRTRRQAFGRRAPAHRDRARHPEERADPGARRGDERPRRRDRGPRQGGDRLAQGRQDDLHHRPPPVDRARGRQGHLRRRRPHRRDGQLQRAQPEQRPFRGAAEGRRRPHRRRSPSQHAHAGRRTRSSLTAACRLGIADREPAPGALRARLPCYSARPARGPPQTTFSVQATISRTTWSKDAVQRSDEGRVAAAGDRRGGTEVLVRTDHAVAVVEDAHRNLHGCDRRTDRRHAEGANVGEHPVVDRESLPRPADAAEPAGILEGLYQPRLDDVRKAVAPLRIREILDRRRRGVHDDLVAGQRLEGARRRHEQLAAGGGRSRDLRGGRELVGVRRRLAEGKAGTAGDR